MVFYAQSTITVISERPSTTKETAGFEVRHIQWRVWDGRRKVRADLQLFSMGKKIKPVYIRVSILNVKNVNNVEMYFSC